MDRVSALTEQFHGWYDHSPRAQRACARFTDDVIALKTWVTPKAHELWERVVPLIDPSSKPNAAHGNTPAGTPGASRS
jgi:hypothetical protein